MNNFCASAQLEITVRLSLTKKTGCFLIPLFQLALLSKTFDRTCALTRLKSRYIFQSEGTLLLHPRLLRSGYDETALGSESQIT